MTTHLLDPESDLGRCRNRQPGEKVERWRYKVKCEMCLGMTAPTALTSAEMREVAIFETRDGKRIPIRCSAVLADLRAHSLFVAADELEKESKSVGGYCPKCKVTIADPIVIIDPKNDRVMYGCPECAPPDVRALYDSEGIEEP